MSDLLEYLIKFRKTKIYLIIQFYKQIHVHNT